MGAHVVLGPTDGAWAAPLPPRAAIAAVLELVPRMIDGAGLVAGIAAT